jgi:hypothetical protein
MLNTGKSALFWLDRVGYIPDAQTFRKPYNQGPPKLQYPLISNTGHKPHLLETGKGHVRGQGGRGNGKSGGSMVLPIEGTPTPQPLCGTQPLCRRV